MYCFRTCIKCRFDYFINVKVCIFCRTLAKIYRLIGRNIRYHVWQNLRI